MNFKIFKKAMPARQLEQELFKLVSGELPESTYTSAELLNFNKSWVFTCNSKNALSVATTPLHLYYNSTGKQIKHTNYKPISKKTFIKLTSSINDIKIKSAENIVEIVEHPIIELFKKVNETQNYMDFTKIIMEYLGLLGNAYILVNKNENDLPIELVALLSENVEKVIDEDGHVVKYKYIENIGDRTTTKEYDANEIIHLANYGPGDRFYGKGELERCMGAVERYSYYDKFESYLNKNNARPDFIASYKNAKLSEKELKDVKKIWMKKFSGVENSGKPLITGEVDIHQLGFSPKDMQFQVGREWCKKEIAACFGVSEAILTLNDANLASSRSALSHYFSLTIIPKLRLLCEKYNQTLLRMYDPDLFVWYSESDFVAPQEMTYADLINAAQLDILSKDEVRQALGYEVQDKDDEQVSDEGDSNEV